MKRTRQISLKTFLLLQAAVGIYSLSGICAKLASGYAAFSMGYLFSYGAELFVLGVYAIIWQQIIKRIDLSIAFANRASAIFWAALWAVVFFREQLSVQNIIGILIIFLGIWVVNHNG